MPAEGDGDLQTLIYVLVVRPRRFPTLSNPAPTKLSETAASLGRDVDSLNISRNSIQRARSKSRVLTATKLRSEFSAVVPLTIHWDGKLMAELTTKEQVDIRGAFCDDALYKLTFTIDIYRLLVLISGVATEQLLGVPKLSSGTGEAQAAAVVQLVKECGTEDCVAAVCFDTTASNTSHHQGACVLIEQMLSKDLLYLACRHMSWN